MLLDKLEKEKLIHPPKWLVSNTHYITLMGSVAYGVSSDNSDIDYYGFGIPPKDMVFPHLKGEIQGFGRQTKRFDQWQEHHIKYNGKNYDISIYNIVRYFHLLMDNNPNMIDSIFTPINCVHHTTQVGHHVRNNRIEFLHKGCFHRFKGYSYEQLHKMNTREPEGKRKEEIERLGMDAKYAYHLVRLICECEQILLERDIDLQRNNEQLKAIRRGEWSIDDVRKWFTEKEIGLEKLYNESKIPHKPDEDKIKGILLECLEMHYGNLSNVINSENRYFNVIKEIQQLVNNI